MIEARRMRGFKAGLVRSNVVPAPVEQVMPA